MDWLLDRMHLTGIKLRNFKAFHDHPEISFAPLTLIYGPNSSGKSSIFQGIKSLSESLLRSNFLDSLARVSRSDHNSSQFFSFRAAGSDFNLGNFKNVVFKQQEGIPLAIGFRLSTKATLPSSPLDPGEELKEHLSSLLISFQFSLDEPSDAGVLTAIELSYGLNGVCGAVTYKPLIDQPNRFTPDQKGQEMFCKWLHHLLFLAMETSKHEDIMFQSLSGFRTLFRHLPLWIISNIASELAINRLQEPSLNKRIMSNKEKVKALRELALKPGEISCLFFSCDILIDGLVYQPPRPDGKSSPGLNAIQYMKDKMMQGKLYAKCPTLDDRHVSVDGNLDENRKRWKDIIECLVKVNHDKHDPWEYLQDVDVDDEGRVGLIDTYNWFENAANLIANLVLYPILAEQTLPSIQHIPPLRPMPKRYYALSSSSWDLRKDDVPYWIQLLGEQRQFSLPHRLNRCNEWLRRFDIDYSVKLSQFNHDIVGPLAAISLTDLSNGCKLTLCDVGFGISQLLPIIVTSIFASEGTILIEQPELHLHPRLQAEMGELFAEEASEKKQFIIETHSEMILLRIRRLIKQNRIPLEAVKVLFVEPSRSGARVTTLRIDDTGQMIDEWPAGFFEDKLTEYEGLL